MRASRRPRGIAALTAAAVSAACARPATPPASVQPAAAVPVADTSPRPSPSASAPATGASAIVLVSPADTPALRAALRDTLRRVLDAAVVDSAFPGAFAVVGNRSGVLASYGAGHLDWAPSPVPDENTLWDLASLTKVVGMTSAMVQMVAEGSVDPEARAQAYLPTWTGPGKQAVRIRDLLTHSSGLPGWRPLYKEADSPAAALALVYATPLDTAPNVRYVYSDLGAILLGQIVERVSRKPLDQYLAERVFGPLGMRDTRYRPPATDAARIAPTEFDPWRQRKLRGEVHDENAFALGGIAGHAGLFSTGHDLARFARMYLNHGVLDGVTVLDSLAIDQFVERQDSTISHRALGWETATGQNSGGRLMSPRAFGHTGFTGTSLWIDPARDLFVVLLTNRVNPNRQNTRIGPVRVALVDAVGAALARALPPPSATSRR